MYEKAKELDLVFMIASKALTSSMNQSNINEIETKLGDWRDLKAEIKAILSKKESEKE